MMDEMERSLEGWARRQVEVCRAATAVVQRWLLDEQLAGLEASVHKALKFVDSKLLATTDKIQLAALTEQKNDLQAQLPRIHQLQKQVTEAIEWCEHSANESVQEQVEKVLKIMGSSATAMRETVREVGTVIHTIIHSMN